ncbi:MAG TPA: glycosyltransferase family 4 protein [Chitinophagaceae bacterium]|nr:glycosyltransferase family 4 protein [Chitinophagaceae bacterium]
MKILFIHNQYQKEGGEDLAVELESKLLTEKGHITKVLLFNNNEIDSRWNKIRFGLQSIYNIYSFKKIALVIKAFNPDVIHVHNIFFRISPSVFFLAKALKIPIVLTLHNYRLICCNALLLRNDSICELCIKKKFPLEGVKYKCYRSSIIDSAVTTTITSIHKLIGTWRNKVDKYISLTEFSRKIILSSSLRINPEKVTVKANFVSDFGEGIWPREDFFLFVGRISPEKGVSLLLDAFSLLPEKKLILIGEGPDKDRLYNKYKNFTNVTFLGKQLKSEVIAYMKRSRALIFPSIWYEGLPFTIIEAFSTGTPVIATKLGAMNELINNDYNGFHFENGNVNDLKECLIKFEAQYSQRRLYINSRDTYLRQYHPDIQYQNILKIYNEVILKKNE